MKHNAGPLPGTYATPWTLRVFDALGGNPLWIGFCFTAAMLMVFGVGRVLLDGAASSTVDDLRVAIVQILVTGYSASAYAALLMSARRTSLDMAPFALRTARWQESAELAGKHPWWLLPVVGASSFLILGVTITNLTTPGPASAWDWSNWNYDVCWHRATTVFFVWWMSCLCYVLLVESRRLTRLTDEIGAVDLLDLSPYQPLVRHGLTNALLGIGMISVLSLLGMESRYWPTLLALWVLFILLAWAGMMLPLRAIRKKMRLVRDEQLQWCTAALRATRDELQSGGGGAPGLADILAYRKLLESTRNWPFDNPTLVRFALYLMIPLASWIGGAMVERGIDLVLF